MGKAGTTLMHEYRRILIVKPSSMGDIVQAMPTLTALRTRFPRARIGWLVKRPWAGLLERVEGLDRIWPVDGGPTGWLALVPALRTETFDLVLDLQGLFRSGVMAWLTGCATRVGFQNAREGSPFFYTHRVPVSAVDMHAVDRYLLLAAAVGAPWETAPEFPFRVKAEDHRLVRALLETQGLPSGASWVAMNVSARWRTKRWPAEHFAAVADALSREGRPVVLVGGPDDRAAADAVRSKMRTMAIDVVGRTPVALLPALLSAASVLVTNDSGPMHVAAAMHVPVVAVFGPTSPHRTGPYGSQHRALSRRIACSPCFSRVCRHGQPLECLTTIASEEVLDAVRERLAASAVTRAHAVMNPAARRVPMGEQ